MEKRTLGKNGPSVSALGLGCMGMSGVYGHADRQESIATIRAALDGGISLIDTGDFFGMGHNESLISEALLDVPRESYQLSVKFGSLRSPDGALIGDDSRPKSIRNFLTYSLKRLGVEYIDIYRPSRLDPDTPIEDTIGAMADLVSAGYIRGIGLSEVGTNTLRRAAAVHPITDLQIEYSVMSRGLEDSILPAARELGIGITAYGVLGRGLITGRWRKDAVAGDMRSRTPRFQDGNVDANLKLVDTLRGFAEARGMSIAQVAIAWVLQQGRDIVPIIGSRRCDQLVEACDSLNFELSAADLEAIDLAVPKGSAAGDRYPTAHMAVLDSERTSE